MQQVEAVEAPPTATRVLQRKQQGKKIDFKFSFKLQHIFSI